MPDELKPCPFCGGEAQARREGIGNWRVVCTADGCGASCHGQTRLRIGSRTAWNRRAPAESVPQDEAVKAVVEAAWSVTSPHCDLDHEMSRLRKALAALPSSPAAPSPVLSEESWSPRGLKELLDIGDNMVKSIRLATEGKPWGKLWACEQADNWERLAKTPRGMVRRLLGEGS